MKNLFLYLVLVLCTLSGCSKNEKPKQSADIEAVRDSITNHFEIINGVLVYLDSLSVDTLVLTDTLHQVNDFIPSPNNKFITYFFSLGTVDEPGIWDDSEKVPQREINAMVILDVGKKKAILRKDESDGNFISPGHWGSDSIFYYTMGSGFSVDYFFAFHTNKDSLELLPYGTE
jgi:hypothetical protein